MKRSQKKNVLVAVLKSRRDLRLLLREHWYRIPVSFLPKRSFSYLAFYQPAIFGKHGKRIKYFARIKKRKAVPRITLLPKENEHLHALDDYAKFTFTEIFKLPNPIKNIIPRRVSFGFTTLNALKNARDMLQLYGVPRTEQILEGRLKQLGIRASAEHTVTKNGRRCRIDLVVRCQEGSIAIECDNDKAHASKIQKQKDVWKNKFLKRLGWHVLRFRERDILTRADHCITRIQKLIHSLGGVLDT